MMTDLWDLAVCLVDGYEIQRFRTIEIEEKKKRNAKRKRSPDHPNLGCGRMIERP